MTQQHCSTKEMKGKTPLLPLMLACLGMPLFSLSALAQTDVFWTGGTGGYNDGSNWDIGAPPFGSDPFLENGVINNGGVAQLDAPVSIEPADLRLGDGADSSGTLELSSGGAMNILGDFQVGINGGVGHLSMVSGSSLIVGDDMRNRGAANSSVHLSGDASVDINDEGEFLRDLRVSGPDVSFSAGSLIFNNETSLTAEITGASHSPLNASGGAALGGTLNLEFNGATPGAGDRWTIIDSGSVTGSFSTVNSNVEVTEPGFSMFVQSGPGGANGTLTEIVVDTRLQLSVDRGTGEATINNLTTSTDLDTKGYLITSPGNQLDPSGWTSFSDGGLADWQEFNPGSNHLSELNLPGSRSIGGNTSVSLGAIYSSPSEFAADADLTFQYTDGNGETQDGLIEYSGPDNNIVLIVDTSDGTTHMQNQSVFDVDIDSYLITSESSSLVPDNWTSLTDGGASGWEEANAAANHVGELNLDEAMSLGGRSSAIALGTLFDPAGSRDLVFEFSLATGEVIPGIIAYDGTIFDGGGGEDGIPGDYNNNGQVEQGDLDLVLLNWGDTIGDPNSIGWTNPEHQPMGQIDQGELDGVLLNWGNTAGLAASAAVPEPSTLLLLLLTGGLAALVRRS